MVEKITTSMGKWDNFLFRIRVRLFPLKNKTNDWRKMPVIINNFNRLDDLKKQLAWLEAAGMQKIFIIDNNSTYPPLLAFYRKTRYKVYRLDENVGHLALWQTILFQKFKNVFYVYTDPDILPVETCPANAVAHFFSLLMQYPDKDKVGFGLVINDLPDHYPLKEKVIRWEQQHWAKAVAEDVYEAPIDTTFALYRPGARDGWERKALRTGGAFVARHSSWYLDPQNISEEERFYMDHAGKSGGWNAALTGKQAYVNY